MFNIAVCSEDLDDIKIIGNYLFKLSLYNNFKYKLYTYQSICDTLTNSNNKIDIFFIFLKSTNNEFVVNVDSIIKMNFKDTRIIYVPEIIDFMINGFCLKDYNYILKPVNFESVEDELMSLICGLKVQSYKHNFLHKNISNFDLMNEVPYKDIFYIKSCSDGCTIYTKDTSINVGSTLDKLEGILDSTFMYRCNNEHIVNLKKINKVGIYFVISNSKYIVVDKERFELLKNKLVAIFNLI